MPSTRQPRTIQRCVNGSAQQLAKDRGWGVHRRTVMAEGGYRGEPELVIAYRKPFGGSGLRN